MEENKPNTENGETNNVNNVVEEQPKAEEVKPETEGSNANSIEKHKLLAVVGYIVPFLFFIPLLTEAKDNKFARYHANQQLLLLLFWIVSQIIASLLTFILIGMLLYPVIYIAGIIFMVMGIINALNGEMKPLPVLGKYELIK